MVEVLPIETPSLGDRSYLVHDGENAAVIDPQRDVDRLTALADAEGVRITHVAETHVHNDYLTGGLALSRMAGASYLVNAADPVRFDRTPVSDGDAVRISGGLELWVIATPGHTFSHLSYALAAGGQVAGVFTGGSLLYGSTGRTDLLGPEHAEALARAQHASAHRLAGDLPEATPVYPTHGFGSFCAASQADTRSSTIGQEKRSNPALTLGEQEYVSTLLAGLDAWPAYYAQMGPANLAGPGVADLSPPEPADPATLRRRIEAGEWVVDLRDRTAFAAGFLPGSVCFSLDGSFASYLGWVIPWGSRVTLLGETRAQIREAVRESARIGFDRLAGAATGRPQEWAGGRPLATLRRATFRDLAALIGGNGHPDGPVVLDVRRRLEWCEGHIPGAVHIPVHELPQRLAEVPPGEVWVHCGAGYRAMIAASLLAAAGRHAVSVDDEFANAAEAGLPITHS